MVFNLEFFEGENVDFGVILDLRKSHDVKSCQYVKEVFPCWIFGGGGWEMGRMCFCIILRGVVIVEGEGGIYKVYVHMEML